MVGRDFVSASKESPQKKPVIGLVGGVGAGKSFLSRALAENPGFAIINGDSMGHEVLRQSATKSQIRQHFGDSVFDEKGEVIRPAVGKLVFGTGPEERAARETLERIVHPQIRELLKQEIDKAKSSPIIKAIILDAAVLFEAGWRDLCDAVIFLDVPESERLARVQKNRGWTRKDFLTRESSQLAVESKREKSDFVLDNSGSAENSVSQFNQIFSQITDDLP